MTSETEQLTIALAVLSREAMDADPETRLWRASRIAVQALGDRLHEIGGIAAMHDALAAVEKDLSDDDAELVEGVIDHAWDGIGGWAA